MSTLLMVLAVAAAPAAPSDRLPPQHRQPPSIHDLKQAQTPPAIFTYNIDQHCQVADTRKLQGPDSLLWEDAQQAGDIFHETTEWKFIDGLRRQLSERRVKLLGEMVLDGELVCHVLPSGEVVDAWIERRDSSPGRRRVPTREPVAIHDGGIEDLGTFSLDFQPDPPAP
jgi:hypothetical protein